MVGDLGQTTTGNKLSDIGEIIGGEVIGGLLPLLLMVMVIVNLLRTGKGLLVVRFGDLGIRSMAG